MSQMIQDVHTDCLLVELLTEELPPKALPRLGSSFADALHIELKTKKLLTRPDMPPHWYATPRRLAVQIDAVLSRAEDSPKREKIMPVSVALDRDGTPTPALLKKLEAKGIANSEIEHFERSLEGKYENLYYHSVMPGEQLEATLSVMVSEALKSLPAPKLMRWGDSDVQFVRPVHGLLMLHGPRLIAGEVLGLSSRRCTYGHRFLASSEINIPHAERYSQTLEAKASVVACFKSRRQMIVDQLQAAAKAENAVLKPNDALLDEVTALVEWPHVYVGEFDAEFLSVPVECLILTMQQNQKYFPLFSVDGKLNNRFLIVSNMQVDDASHIISGNERVVRPRLADARFFYDKDRELTLEARLPRLAEVVYHNKLGNQLQRVERLERLAGDIAKKINDSGHGNHNREAIVDLVKRAARLCKVDLITGMVGEFPALQGVMGRYYAVHDGESAFVADAIDQHYRPRFAGDELPQGEVACALALADKLDALVGFFGVGREPTGERDPFGLRRAGLGVLRILVETPLPLDLRVLIAAAAEGYASGALHLDQGSLFQFFQERLRGLLREQEFAPDAIESVLALEIGEVAQVPARLSAIRAFALLPEAEALSAANKRIGNILKKARGELPPLAFDLLQQPAEQSLGMAVADLLPRVQAHVAGQDFSAALLALADIKNTVDHFFDEVMVMDEDPGMRQNRLALLAELHGALNAVADISRLVIASN